MITLHAVDGLANGEASIYRRTALAIFAAIVLVLTSCRQETAEEEPPKRTLKVSLLLSTMPDVRAAVTRSLSEPAGGFSLTDATTVIPELAFEEDLVAAQLIASGKRKPHLWVTLHPSLGDLSAYPRSTFGIESVECRALAWRPLRIQGADLSVAKRVLVANPRLSVAALTAVRNLPTLERVEYYPSDELLAEAADDPSTAKIDGAASANGRKNDGRLILSICRTRSSAFSARESVATDLVDSRLSQMSAEGFTRLAEADVVEKRDFAAEVRRWSRERAKRSLFIALDDSGSMRGASYAAMQKECREIAKHIPDFKEARIFSYSTKTQVAPPGTSLDSVVAGLPLQGGNAIIDAALEVLEATDGAPSTVLIFADSADTNSMRTVGAIEKLKTARNLNSVQFYGVALTPEARSTLQPITDLFNGVTVDGSNFDETIRLIDALR